MFERYAKELQKATSIKALDNNNDEKISKVFSSNARNALKVTLYRWKRGADFVGLEIEGVDTCYWHTAEEENLDYHIKLAWAALKGEIEYNKSPILRLPEVCFKIDNAWHCTLTDKMGALPYHYIKIRIHI